MHNVQGRKEITCPRKLPSPAPLNKNNGSPLKLNMLSCIDNAQSGRVATESISAEVVNDYAWIDK